MATYVENVDTHVIREPISLCSVCLEGWPRSGRASRRSARAMLSGRSSRISTNSSAWMRLTSLAGTGGRLLARRNGGVAVAAVAVVDAAGRASRDCQVGVV